MTINLETHECERTESWWERDAKGIELCRVCDKCRAQKLARYEPWVLSGYSQADVDEPIESEDAGWDWGSQ
jgi:hypothetical protein